MTLRRLADRGAVLVAALLCLLARPALAVPHLELSVRLDPATRVFHAIAEWTGAPMKTFSLDRALTVQSIRAGARALRFGARDGGTLRHWRIEGARPSRLRIEYGGTLAPLDASIDHRAVLGALPPMASPAGSFLPAGGAWLPMPDHAFTYRVHLSLPGHQRGVVPGELTAETVPTAQDDRYEARFAFAVPVHGIDLMAGPWMVRERMLPRAGAGAIRLRTWFPASIDALAEGYLEDSARYLERFAAAIGPYPYAGFSVVASPLPTGFGMPTLTYLGESVLRLPFIRATSLGHEVLHNWWGNGVFVAAASGNWSEGLTTFMADYAFREARSAASATEMRLGWLRDLAALPPGTDAPLTAFRSRVHGEDATLGYGKSAMVFLMLRDRIGAPAFERGLRVFWARHAFNRAGWRDLQAAFESASGQALGAFFSQWLERADAPAPRLLSAQAMPGGLQLGLVQDTPPYALRVPVELLRGEARETHWVEIDGARTAVTIETAFGPERVRLDPDLRLWRRLEATDLPPILRRWTLARAPRVALASPSLEEPARRLTGRLFEHAPRWVSLDEAFAATGPALIIGLHADADAALARRGLARPESLPSNRGSAQVWTQSAGPSVAVISVRDAGSLDALLRPLPHYGGQGWLVFEGARALARGTWPVRVPTVPVQPAPERY